MRHIVIVFAALLEPFKAKGIEQSCFWLSLKVTQQLLPEPFPAPWPPPTPLPPPSPVPCPLLLHPTCSIKLDVLSIESPMVSPSTNADIASEAPTKAVMRTPRPRPPGSRQEKLSQT